MNNTLTIKLIQFMYSSSATIQKHIHQFVHPVHVTVLVKTSCHCKAMITVHSYIIYPLCRGN